MKDFDVLPEPLRGPVVKFVAASLQSEDFQIIPLAGDASSRRYFRVILSNRSWVLMAWEPFDDDGNYPFLSVLRHFSKNKVQVPTVSATSPENGLVLLEDLGDLTLERKVWENQNQALVLPFYYRAIDELIKIHFGATEDKAHPCTAHKIAFNTEKFLWEMNYGREHLLEKLGQVRMSARLFDELQKEFIDICTILDEEPKRISHRDYHSRNLMVKLNKMYVIDFQDARLGPIQYDLVSLLHDSYVNLSPETIETVLEYYLKAAAPKLGHGFSEVHFDGIFRVQILQRCFKACGSFSSFYNQRSDLRYLKYIHPTINKVAKVLEGFPKYRTFYQVLQDSGVLEKKFDSLCVE